ncbi:hypothetical protein GNF10_05225 [Nostoc sp. UCD121]|uniref:hypothetical protein n=1 Tax=Nostoc sp. UCD120 TaxID=2681312 RepID=UPI001626C63F|nr:hypothetical protein [Nostoc sp. UCD120]MBC1220867.1 hypothetical protein [Nostoc sp. UCD120]MBC1275397.1 hypothetical protein [Nostoc sp. UCD121]MBC1299186.1 hypothetical protein [Nostoc sp. UCD122]
MKRECEIANATNSDRILRNSLTGTCSKNLLSLTPQLDLRSNLWVGLKTIVMVIRSIQHWNKTTQEVQFYITSHEA